MRKIFYSVLIFVFAAILFLLGLSYVHNNYLLEGKTVDQSFISLNKHYEFEIRETDNGKRYSVRTKDNEHDILIHENIQSIDETKKGYFIQNQEDFFDWFKHDNYFYVPKNGTMIQMYDTEQQMKKEHGAFELEPVNAFVDHQQ